MKLSRRQAMQVSGTTLAGMSIGLRPDPLFAQAQQPPAAPAPTPDKLVEAPLRNIAPLPLLPDGSAPEHTAAEIGTLSPPYLWRYTKNEPPQIEYDYRKLKVKLDSRGLAKLTGTLMFSDLEPLPRRSQIVLLQCGAPNPRGIVKWTGVRFSDVANMLGIQPFANYVRFVSADKYWLDEDIKTMMHPQVMLAWMLNDEPIPPRHGAPLRLIIPFRYGAHSIKAVSEIYLHSTGMPTPQLPAPA